MHAEHEILGRTYVNAETMVAFEPVGSIPREQFWASEDGYAWDMQELAGALSSNEGVMRNPLSRQMFSPNDVRAIMQHPLCKHLGEKRRQQARMSQGVRLPTIQKLEELAGKLLADQSADLTASRKAIDEFLNYKASLLSTESEAMESLRVPAKDSHSGIAFDCSIGEALRDAQANKVCMHKTGDFIGQAAKYLRSHLD
ncbi:hypothetical protein NA57DRAFT_44829 [Rhizodiscina lignyota]|uniref:Uncharacterized protein n=1 Tax=Rhizodiscina lignyota TaxID=1504668 RepID=A0A9P4I994_9PEZI|nr:hypothetical protein NA57DRAFT_44829 [Rhizodiscina lignyota]